MKFTFTRKANNDEYDAFNGDEYYNGFGSNSDELDADAAEFGSLNAQANDVVAPTTAALKIVNPKGYDEAPVIADFLLNGNTVLLNVEGLESAQAVRLLDYLSGATRMVGGIMTKVGRTTIVVAPKSVDVSSIEAMVGTN